MADSNTSEIKSQSSRNKESSQITHLSEFHISFQTQPPKQWEVFCLTVPGHTQIQTNLFKKLLQS